MDAMAGYRWGTRGKLDELVGDGVDLDERPFIN